MKIGYGTMGVVPLHAIARIPVEQQVVYIWALNLQNISPYPPPIGTIAIYCNMSEEDVISACKELVKRGMLSEGYTEEKSTNRAVYTVVKPTIKKKPRGKKKKTWLTEYEELFLNKTQGVSFPYERYAKPFKDLENKHTREVVLASWKKYLDKTDVQFVSAHHFARNFGAYIKKDHTPTNVVNKGSTPGWTE